ncbi:DMT family transporter [Thalassococcus sp. CAU 1522]|uniref:DMT family transporter n=1 Tax=Thalassococcus arenae TaxID=2851652 RepID=A0ABS6NC25_9RHOB|nr:DMT family transporter [Thalassococcus arenae]MBV2361095.1 DMT family transporter [Thalassococcus arenae]
MTQTSLSARAWAELLLLGLIWGGSFLAIRIALDEIGPLTVVLFRTGLGAAALWLVVLARGIAVPRDMRLWGALAVMGLLNNVIPFSLMAWGQLHIETGLTAILNAATAIFGVLVAALVFADERLTPRRLGGVSLGFAGVVLAIGPDALGGFDLTSLAQLAVIAGTVSYACASAWGRARLGGLHPVMAAAGMLTGATILVAPVTVIAEGLPSLALGAATWGGILYYALAATAFAYLLYYRVLAMAGAGNLMLVTLVIPPVAIGLGAWIRDERLAPLALAGFALIAAGLMVMNSRRAGRTRKPV